MPGFFISNFFDGDETKNLHPEHCVDGILNNANYYIRRNTLNKFMADKLFDEDDDYIIITEGVIFNKKALCGKKTWFETVKKMIVSDETNYFDSFRGGFSGAHYNKKNDQWVVYSDALGTKPIYYYHKNGKWIVASEVYYITQALRKAKENITPDEEAAYNILSYGFMTSDSTMVKEIKKLPYGCYIKLSNDDVSINRYFDFCYCEAESNMTEDEIVDQLDKLFKEAVALEFEKDREYGYDHIATLSGGLDSRMTIWAATEMGYPMLNITFGQSDCMDIQVATKVAKHINSQLLINTLDNGDMLLAYEPIVKMNSGQSLYSGISHSYLTLEKINFNKYGLLHTGDLGDAVVGVLSDKKEGSYPGAYSVKLAHNVKNNWDGIENVEKFKMRTRGFLGVGASKSVCENFVCCCSPFLYRDFFVFCLEKIPYCLRKEHYIYKKWVLSKYSDASKIPLQRYNGGLMTEGKVKQTIRKIKRIGIGTTFNWLLYKAHIKKSLSRKTVKTSMNPIDMWFSDETLAIKKNLDTRFQQRMTLLCENNLIGENFSKDLKDLYYSGTATEKTQAITVVEALAQLFVS